MRAERRVPVLEAVAWAVSVSAAWYLVVYAAIPFLQSMLREAVLP